MLHAKINLKNGDIIECNFWRWKIVTYDHGDIDNPKQARDSEILIIYKNIEDEEFFSRSESRIKIPLKKIANIQVTPYY